MDYNHGSTARVQQLLGDVDVALRATGWQAKKVPPWDRLANQAGYYDTVPSGSIPSAATNRTNSTTRLYYNVEGAGLGHSFEGPNGQLVLIFGDTFKFSAFDTIGWVADPSLPPDQIALNFFTTRGATFTGQPQNTLGIGGVNSRDVTEKRFTVLVAPDSYGWVPPAPGPGSGPMGPFEIPYSGITAPDPYDNYNPTMYVTCRLGANASTRPVDYAAAYSILTRFDPIAPAFTYTRTIAWGPTASASNGSMGGCFLQTAFRATTDNTPNSQGLTMPPPPGGGWSGGAGIVGASPGDNCVMMFGAGYFRESRMFLARVPIGDVGHEYAAAATDYFAGLSSSGAPIWSQWAPDACVSVFPDADTSVGDFSVAKLGDLWVMLYDSDHNFQSSKGRWFNPNLKQLVSHAIICRTAPNPWGPWSAPMPIFSHQEGQYAHNPTGSYITQSTSLGSNNDGIKGSLYGPAGPNANTTGGAFAPMIIERLSQPPANARPGTKFDVFFTISTWIPYYVVLMRATFTLK